MTEIEQRVSDALAQAKQENELRDKFLQVIDNPEFVTGVYIRDKEGNIIANLDSKDEQESGFIRHQLKTNVIKEKENAENLIRILSLINGEIPEDMKPKEEVKPEEEKTNE